jgi:hypothetical protein
MAGEATLFVKYRDPINFTVADGTGIEKGTFLTMTDPMTAIAVSAANQTFAGIASAEKIASNGNTKLGVFRNGIFKVLLSGSCVVGDPLGVALPLNCVASVVATGNLSGSRIIGTALETGATGETILMELNPMNLGTV